MLTDPGALLDSCPDSILIAERDGRLSVANLSACRLFGCEREELFGKSVAGLVSADGMEASLLTAVPCELAQWKVHR